MGWSFCGEVAAEPLGLVVLPRGEACACLVAFLRRDLLHRDEAGIGGYGISLLKSWESGLLALYSRSPDASFWNSPLTNPVATFLSLANKFAPCAHTNINNPATDPFASLDVLKALNADIDRLDAGALRPVNAQELLFAPVPASCEHPAGRLANGLLPGIPVNHGSMQLGWLARANLPESAGTAFGDLNGTGTSDAAVVLSCNAGGVSCYGLGDFFTMPAPLANLIDGGGPDQVNQDTDRLCAFPSTDPGAQWVALGMQSTGWRSWRVLWAQSA